MDERRTARVSEAIREELLEILGFELADPRVAGVEISAVNVSPDSRHADVKIVVRGTEKEQKQAIAALDHAAGFLRHELAARLDLRRTPELQFTADLHPGAAERVEILLKRAGKRRGAVR
jgi:ribosome-binding factor A